MVACSRSNIAGGIARALRVLFPGSIDVDPPELELVAELDDRFRLDVSHSSGPPGSNRPFLAGS